MWLTHMLESRWHPQRRSARFVVVGSVGKARWRFDFDPVLGSPSRPVGAGEPFGDQAFQAEPECRKTSLVSNSSLLVRPGLLSTA